MAKDTSSFPIGSAAPEVLFVNSQNIDEFVNGRSDSWADRIGSQRKTLAGIEKDISNIVTSLDTASFTFIDEAAGLSGTTNRQYFRTPANDGGITAFIYYVNENGSAVKVAELAGATAIKGATDSVSKLKLSLDYLTTMLPESLQNTLLGYSFMVTDVTGKLGLFGVNDNGGVEVADVEGELQDYLANLVSSKFSNRISGYQFIIFSEDLSKGLLAIDDDGGLWLPGLTKPLQDYLVSDRVKISVVNGIPGIYSSAGGKILPHFSVATLNGLGTGGYAVTYLDKTGSVKAGRITEHENPESNIAFADPLYQHPISLASVRAIYFDHNGQSLALGGGGDIKALSTYDESVADICAIFSGQGQGVNGGGTASPTTNAGLSGLTPARARIWQEAPMDGAIRKTAYLLKAAAKTPSDIPLIVGRVNARGGTPMSGIKKGTQVYADGVVSMQAFLDRVNKLGLPGSIDVVELIHGGDDSHVVTDFGQYLADLIRYKADKLADINAFSAQSLAPLFSASQLGSRVREAHPSKGMAYGDMIAQDQFDLMVNDNGVIMPCPQWPLNRTDTYRLDFTHLLSNGYALLGEYLAQARAYTREGVGNPNPGKRWVPVMPIQWSWNDRVLTHKWHSPFGGALRINNALGVAPGGGVSLLNSSANPVSFEQVDDFTFRTTFDKVPAGNDFIQIGFNSNQGFRVGDGQGGFIPDWKYPLVNISDSSTRMSHAMPTVPLTNWAVLVGKLPLNGSFSI